MILRRFQFLYPVVVLLIWLALSIGGCASVDRYSVDGIPGSVDVSDLDDESEPGPSEEAGLTDLDEPSENEEAMAAAIAAIAAIISEQEIAAADAPLEEPGATPKIPVEVNDQVRKWIHYFAVRDRDRFQRFLDRGEQYRHVVERILAKHGVPKDLYFLAMIESGFNTHARSRAAAVGPWQFISATGRRYGLKQAYLLDERRDIIRSTESAARYLKDLHQMFDSWYLAMASYNAGEGRVRRVVRQRGTRDFWELVRRRALPRETMNYVPKFLAAKIIGSDPVRFGFNKNPPRLYPDDVRALRLPAKVSLNSVARTAGTDAESLRWMNPHLYRGVVPSVRGGSYEIWVPVNEYARYETSGRQIASLPRVQTPTRAGSLRLVAGRYRVRSGDSLYSISRRFGMSVSQLRSLNGIRGNVVRVGQSLRIQSQTVSGPIASRYRVRRGDNLYLIARRFGSSVSEIKQLNRLERNRIYVGQVLKVPAEQGS